MKFTIFPGGNAGFFNVAISPLERKFQCTPHIFQILLILIGIGQDIAVFRGCYITVAQKVRDCPGRHTTVMQHSGKGLSDQMCVKIAYITKFAQFTQSAVQGLNLDGVLAVITQVWRIISALCMPVPDLLEDQLHLRHQWDLPYGINRLGGIHYTVDYYSQL